MKEEQINVLVKALKAGEWIYQNNLLKQIGWWNSEQISKNPLLKTP